MREPRQRYRHRTKPFKISEQDIAMDEKPKVICQKFEPMKGVVPDTEMGRKALAMDATPYDEINASYQNDSDMSFFVGYPALASLAQTTEHYNQALVFADEVTRNWIEVKSEGEGGAEKAKVLEQLLIKYDIKRLIHRAVMQDCFFGVSHIFIDTGANSLELENPLVIDPRAVNEDTELSFRCVDPTWVYPALYNTSDPLKADFYKPKQWFVFGQVVHESRFLDIVTRPVPDILKPSYNFGGLSLIQLMLPYVNNWRDIQSNVIKIVKTLRMRGLKTDMDARLQNPGEFDKRAKLFTKHQDNFGMWTYDLTEELTHHQTSLSDLSALLSNYQEQLCVPARTTNLKLLGTPPAGLSASGDAEVDTWHETVSGYQENYHHAINTILKLIQLKEFGEIDNDIYFEFLPLDEVGEKEQAEVAEIQVRTIATASDSQIISTEQAAEILASIPGAGFENIDLDDIPDPEDDELPSSPKEPPKWGSLDED